MLRCSCYDHLKSARVFCNVYSVYSFKQSLYSSLFVLCYMAAAVCKPALGCCLLIVCVACSLVGDVQVGIAAFSSSLQVVKLKQNLFSTVYVTNLFFANHAVLYLSKML